jgi:hypothetical protein
VRDSFESLNCCESATVQMYRGIRGTTDHRSAVTHANMAFGNLLQFFQSCGLYRLPLHKFLPSRIVDPVLELTLITCEIIVTMIIITILEIVVQSAFDAT